MENEGEKSIERLKQKIFILHRIWFKNIGVDKEIAKGALEHIEKCEEAIQTIKDKYGLT